MLHQNSDFETLRSDIINIFFEHYRTQGKDVRVLASGSLGVAGNEGASFFITFFVNKTTVLRYTIPNAPRTFGGLWIGVGPEYVPVDWIFGNTQSFSDEISEFSIKRNLQLLDESLKKMQRG
jgi:hypothetical protein